MNEEESIVLEVVLFDATAMLFCFFSATCTYLLSQANKQTHKQIQPARDNSLKESEIRHDFSNEIN